MREKVFVVVLGILILFVSSANSSTIINVNAQNNAVNNPIILHLDAGTYNVDPIGISDGGLYNAWSVRYGNTNTWAIDYVIQSDAFSTMYVGSSGTWYSDALTALGNATSCSFVLSNATDVKFSIFDGPNGYEYTGDNVGGMSLRVSAVPIPAALWLFGSGLLGIIGIRKRLSS